MPAAKDRQADEDQGAGMPALIQWTRPVLGTGNGKRQQVIQDEAEQKSGEKEQGRSRDDARGSGVGSLVAQPGPFHVCSRSWRRRSRQYDN